MSAVKFALPPAAFFSPPIHLNKTLPPPATTSPFYISPSLYVSLLDIRVPITVALVYAVTVHILNSYASATRPPTPYGFAKTKAFHYFVIAHNLLLAVYSAWTFVGIFDAVRVSVPAVWKGGVAATMHGMCKIHEDGSGLWNGGLAFYGWLFYLSKFYEVVDTAIILAKGKKSSLLQTYHHAGAMMCMYAGVRFMAPPIFIFVLFNSAIHALMYTYYTLSALKIRVPNIIKRSLTSLQISQFVIGGGFAAMQLFISYVPPASFPLMGKLEGIMREGTDEFITCLSGNGEVWALLTNVVYLTPLTYLFVMFFINSYTKKGAAPTKSQSKAVDTAKPVQGKAVVA